jgi:hypothetical protein
MERKHATEWKEFLAHEGYRPELEVNEDKPTQCRLRFKAEGRTYLAYLDEADTAFAHLELAYNVREGRDLGTLVRLANEVNALLKGAKTTVDREADVVRFHLEWFLEGIPPLRVIERSLSQLASAASAFFDRLAENEPVKALA